MGSTPQAFSSYVNDLDLIDFMELQLLSHSCKRSVCRMLQVIYNEIFKGNMTKKLDAYNLLKIDPTKVH
ncbi:hypothetical protein YC2023_084827 [Brassica napus]